MHFHWGLSRSQTNSAEVLHPHSNYWDAETPSFHSPQQQLMGFPPATPPAFPMCVWAPSCFPGDKCFFQSNLRASHVLCPANVSVHGHGNPLCSLTYSPFIPMFTAVSAELRISWWKQSASGSQAGMTGSSLWRTESPVVFLRRNTQPWGCRLNEGARAIKFESGGNKW